MMNRGRQEDEAKRQTRHGVLTMELVLTLPILFVVLMALLEFTLLFYARGQIVEASRAGARRASLPGVTAADVEAEIQQILPPRLQTNLQLIVELGEHTGDVVFVGVQVPMTAAAPDFLALIGVPISGQNLYSETRMIRE